MIRSALRTTAAAAGSSDGWPRGYIMNLCSAIDSSTRRSLNGRERVTRAALLGGITRDRMAVGTIDVTLIVAEEL